MQAGAGQCISAAGLNVDQSVSPSRLHSTSVLPTRVFGLTPPNNHLDSGSVHCAPRCCSTQRKPRPACPCQPLEVAPRPPSPPPSSSSCASPPSIAIRTPRNHPPSLAEGALHRQTSQWCSSASTAHSTTMCPRATTRLRCKRATC